MVMLMMRLTRGEAGGGRVRGCMVESFIVVWVVGAFV
jgi:hypothetical protein